MGRRLRAGGGPAACLVWRFVLSAGRLSLEEAQSVLGALGLLLGPLRPAALAFIGQVCREHGTQLDVSS
jgi:hypothetical protein